MAKRHRLMEASGSSSTAGGRTTARRQPNTLKSLGWLNKGMNFHIKWSCKVQKHFKKCRYKDRIYMSLISGNVRGLTSSRSRVGNCENESWESLDVVEMYKSCLHGPQYFVSGELTKAGSLNVENRLMHYLIAYILVQRNTNHTQPTINDLKLMFAIREGILVNWHAEILKYCIFIIETTCIRDLHFQDYRSFGDRYIRGGLHFD
ncbi:hypothetical protein Lal_00022559 [Lupinus albus]|nr:hypothetical protein Lal_00022559 [Lupinus albus]